MSISIYRFPKEICKQLRIKTLIIRYEEFLEIEGLRGHLKNIYDVLDAIVMQPHTYSASKCNYLIVPTDIIMRSWH